MCGEGLSPRGLCPDNRGNTYLKTGGTGTEELSPTVRSHSVKEKDMANRVGGSGRAEAFFFTHGK